MKYKKGDCVVEEGGFNAILIQKLKNYYWKVSIPMGEYYEDIWHEDDFKIYNEEVE